MSDYFNKVCAIRPSKDLRNNYPEISKLCKERPVAITVNGRESLFVVSYEEYIQLVEKLEAMRKQKELVEKMVQARENTNYKED